MSDARQGNLCGITPFLHVPDLEAAIRFFGLLGFEVEFQAWNYAYVAREGFAVRFMQSVAEDGTMFPPHRGFSIYIDVEDVDAEIARIGPGLQCAGIETIGPVNQVYDQREYMVRMPDGNVLTFGQPIPAGSVR